jgi:hypothetical protein
MSTPLLLMLEAGKQGGVAQVFNKYDLRLERDEGQESCFRHCMGSLHRASSQMPLL